MNAVLTFIFKKYKQNNKLKNSRQMFKEKLLNIYKKSYIYLFMLTCFTHFILNGICTFKTAYLAEMAVRSYQTRTSCFSYTIHCALTL